MSIRFPTTLDEAIDAAAAPGVVIRAGGTDLQERIATHVREPELVDLSRLGDLRSIDQHPDGSVTIGALVTIARAARELAATHAGLSLTAGGLATPQVRSVATVGGNLTQATRCSYARHPDLSCHKSGGNTCLARGGEHRHGVIFDTGPCVHPHPSSIGAALLAHEATIRTTRRPELAIVDLFGDGSDGSRDHLLEPGEILTHVHLPPTGVGERGAYHRAISRFEAEWPLVEAVARLTIDDGTIVDAHVAVGGVAPVPRRLERVSADLVGRAPTHAAIHDAAQLAVQGADPLQHTAYKVDLLVGCVMEVLERAAEA